MSRASAPDFESLVSRVHLVGRSSGLVKKLPAFDRSRHVVPDAVNAATTQFLARLCERELATEAEGWYQRARGALGYKRRELALDVTPPAAVLSAKDFVFELAYALQADAPEEYRCTRTLYQVSRPALVRDAAFDELFARQFSELGFELRKGVRVEAVIDAVEDLDEPDGLRVDYPSDASSCTLTVTDVDAVVVCDGATLTLRFPRAGSPRELVDAFAAVRGAFVLSRQRTLIGLLG